MTVPVLLLLFVGLPIAELALLFKVNAFLSLGGTLALVAGTGLLGAWLARRQGLRQIGLIQQALAEGRMPAPHLVDGILILLAGTLLITPGLITDSAGFLLLVPPVRRRIKRALGRWLQQKIRQGVVDVAYVEW